MVVIGAGASYDSVDPDVIRMPGEAAQYRPPLTIELFAPKFGYALERFPKAAAVVNRLRRLSDGRTLESELEALQVEADEMPARREHLAAVRFYLQEVLHRCGSGWHHYAKATNYVDLLDQLELWRHRTGDSVLVVTFNYDQMLEKAFEIVPGRALHHLDTYVAGDDYRVIKIHGSVTWVHPVRFAGLPLDNETDVVDHASKDGFEVDDKFIVNDSPGGAFFPALALPMLTKSGFECPAEHVDAMRDWMRRVDRVLMVGWRAAEQHFLEVWRKEIPANLQWIAAVAPGTGAAESLANLEAAGIKVDRAEPMDETFSSFVHKGSINKLLQP